MKKRGSNDHTNAQREVLESTFLFLSVVAKGYMIVTKTKSWNEFALEAARLFSGAQQDS